MEVAAALKTALDAAMSFPGFKLFRDTPAAGAGGASGCIEPGRIGYNRRDVVKERVVEQVSLMRKAGEGSRQNL